MTSADVPDRRQPRARRSLRDEPCVPVADLRKSEFELLDFSRWHTSIRAAPSASWAAGRGRPPVPERVPAR